MKFKIKHAALVLAGIGAAALITIAMLHFNRMILLQNYLDTLTANAQDGDIICRLGDRTWSLYFKGLSKRDKRFSHLGIIRRNGESLTVINAEGRAWAGKDCVNEVALQEFITPARMIGLYRLDHADGKAIVREALTMIGRPFDWDFDLKNTDKLYCTELLYAVLKKTAPEIELETVHTFRRDIVPLEAVSNSTQFREVLFFE
ncbi:MAG: hypothetical protein LBH70_07335 [Spirochaetaceae bacterium]|jgi:uncharacterized protein YycO|nr:hypothetical protein [Spirochaetaceae bacterium]